MNEKNIGRWTINRGKDMLNANYPFNQKKNNFGPEKVTKCKKVDFLNTISNDQWSNQVKEIK